MLKSLRGNAKQQSRERKTTWPSFLVDFFKVPMGAARFVGGGGGGGVWAPTQVHLYFFFSLEEDNDLESKDEIDSDSTDLTDDDSDEATDTAVDTDDADSEDSGKTIFRMHRVILLLPFRAI